MTGQDVFFVWGRGGRFGFFFGNQKLEKDEVLNEGLERFVGGFVELIHWIVNVDYFVLKLISCGSFDFQVYDFLENVLCSQCKKR